MSAHNGAWLRSWLLGFAQAAHDIRRGALRAHLLVGLAIEPFRVGYRAGIATASGR